MKRFFSARKFSVLYGAVLALFTVYVLLDAFVIPRTYSASESAASASTQSSTTTSTSSSSSSSGTAAVSKTGSAVSTDSSYSDDNISITHTTAVVDDTTVYVADVQVTSLEYLKPYRPEVRAARLMKGIRP